jgi:5,10-methenyltetrahydromethanopterin hydrogenase
MEVIEFFIDTHNTEAFEHVMCIINMHSSEDVDEKYFIQVIRDIDEGCGAHYMCLKGTWHSYKLFLPKPNGDDKKYHYSLTHYEE